MSSVERTWQCKCGEIKAKLKGDPILNFQCHCRSCVAAAKFIEHETNKSGTPMLHPQGGGACCSSYAAGNIEFLSQLSTTAPARDNPTTNADQRDSPVVRSSSSSKLRFVRVGDKGKPWRCYTTCCGTQMTNFISKRMVVLNRNGIRDGTTPYEPSSKPPLNTMKKDAFDPSTVPEPSHSTVPVYWNFRFLGPILNPFGENFQCDVLFPLQEEATIVPITW